MTEVSSSTNCSALSSLSPRRGPGEEELRSPGGGGGGGGGLPRPPRFSVPSPSEAMSTGSLSDAEDLPEVERLACDGGLKMDRGCSPRPHPPPAPPPPPPPPPPLPLRGERHDEEGSVGAGDRGASPRKARGAAAAAGKGRKKAPPGKRGSPLRGGAGGGPGGQAEGKQVQRNAANARERARMRVLSKAFSRLKTTLPWVPPDTKLSKLDTLRLASSYIAHLRQILASDKYENGYIHPVNLTWPFMVAGKPENELKEAVNTARLCGPTAS